MCESHRCRREVRDPGAEYRQDQQSWRQDSQAEKRDDLNMFDGLSRENEQVESKRMSAHTQAGEINHSENRAMLAAANLP